MALGGNLLPCRLDFEQKPADFIELGYIVFDIRLSQGNYHVVVEIRQVGRQRSFLAMIEASFEATDNRYRLAEKFALLG